MTRRSRNHCIAFVGGFLSSLWGLFSPPVLVMYWFSGTWNSGGPNTARLFCLARAIFLTMSIDVKLSRVDRVYKPGESVSGVIVVNSASPMSFGGIVMTVEGAVTLQLSARSVGLFEAFYSSLKPLQLMRCAFVQRPYQRIGTNLVGHVNFFLSAAIPLKSPTRARCRKAPSNFPLSSSSVLLKANSSMKRTTVSTSTSNIPSKSNSNEA